MQDSFDQTVSATSPAALRHYDSAVDAFLHAWPGGFEALDAAIAEEPGVALPHALKALMLHGRGRGSLAREAITQAQKFSRHALAREQSQVELITAMVEGRSADALTLVIEHARKYPTDALAASTALGAYGLFAFSGLANHDAARLAFTEALAAHFRTDFPWLLAYRGWARIEAGQVEAGLAMAQHAIRLRPENGHNAHILMHGLFESAAPAEALAFVGEWLPTYPPTALMWGHLQWHAALAEIELGHCDAAVARLLGPIADYLPIGAPFMGLADITSLLWRLGLLGAGPLPWELAQEHARQHFPNGSNVFGELHLAMLAAARRDHEALATCRSHLAIYAERGHPAAPAAMLWVQALAALANGDEAMAREAIDACLSQAIRLGGSHAQRGVVTLTRDVLRLPDL